MKRIIFRTNAARPLIWGRVVLGTLLVFVSAAASQASELIYYPLNPSFGGSPLNGSVLLGSAQAQNKHTDPNTGAARAGMEPKTPL